MARFSKAWTAAALFVLGAAAAGYTTAADGEHRTITVTISNFAFEPQLSRAKVGDTILFINKDLVPHTATEAGGRWDSGSLDEGQSWTLELTSSGLIDFICRFHPAMTGSVSVE